MAERLPVGHDQKGAEEQVVEREPLLVVIFPWKEQTDTWSSVSEERFVLKSMREIWKEPTGDALRPYCFA